MKFVFIAEATMLWRRPDGKKKAYVRLTSDHDALDVANKVCAEVLIIVRCDEMSLTGELLAQIGFI